MQERWPKKWIIPCCSLAVAVGLLLLGAWFPSLTGQTGYAGINKPKHRQILRVKPHLAEPCAQASHHVDGAPFAEAPVSGPLIDPASETCGLTGSSSRACPPASSLPPAPARASPAQV